MHLWIVLAAFALTAVTPFLAAPGDDVDQAQLMQDAELAAEAADDADEA